MKPFNHTRPLRDELGKKIGEFPAPTYRVTNGALGGQFGCDKRRRLVVGLEGGDIISVRPSKTRRTLTITAVDLYRYMIRCKAAKAALEKANKVKARKAETRQRQAIDRADRRLRAQLRGERKG